MAKLTKDTLFKPAAPRAETVMDKTTRAARQILDDEKHKRAAKTEQLRKARIARDGGK